MRWTWGAEPGNCTGSRASTGTGRLVGLDPADAMLEVGRTEREDIEWTLGDLVAGLYDGQAGGPFEAEFDLVTMSGHAFQVFLTDEQTAANLAGARRALRPGALLAFETRNPAARAWQRWTPEHERRVQAPDGRQAWSAHTLERVEGDLVTFSTAYGIQGWAEPGHSRSTLRFPEARTVNALLADSGFEVQAQYGFWDRTPLTDTSPEIITWRGRCERGPRMPGAVAGPGVARPGHTGRTRAPAPNEGSAGVLLLQLADGLRGLTADLDRPDRAAVAGAARVRVGLTPDRPA